MRATTCRATACSSRPSATLLGVRAGGALCAIASTIIFGVLAEDYFGPGARWGTCAFAVVAVGDIWLGRLAFALGVTLALAAGLALRRGHTASAVVLSALAAAASPVAGLLLGLAGLTVSLHRRAPRAVLALGLPAAAVVVPLALLFPEGGHEPFPIISFGVGGDRGGGVPACPADRCGACCEREGSSIWRPAFSAWRSGHRSEATSSAMACCWRGRC